MLNCRFYRYEGPREKLSLYVERSIRTFAPDSEHSQIFCCSVRSKIRSLLCCHGGIRLIARINPCLGTKPRLFCSPSYSMYASLVGPTGRRNHIRRWILGFDLVEEILDEDKFCRYAENFFHICVFFSARFEAIVRKVILGGYCHKCLETIPDSKLLEIDLQQIR